MEIILQKNNEKKFTGNLLKNLEKSWNFVSPKKWEPCVYYIAYVNVILKSLWNHLLMTFINETQENILLRSDVKNYLVTLEQYLI